MTPSFDGAGDHRERAGLDRRTFIGAAAGGILGLAAATHAQPALQPGVARLRPLPRRNQKEGRPKNVILLISDGMSPGVMEMAELFAQQTRSRGTRWVELMNEDDVLNGILSTGSADGPVTDSAAAGTAFSVGERTLNRKLNVLPDGRRPTPLAVTLERLGMATGLVTTTHLGHATPAAFLVNEDSRRNYPSIARKMLERRVDVCLGGGTDHFTPELFDELKPDAQVVRSRSALKSADLKRDEPLWGVFTPDHMHFECDRPNDEPTLAEMTKTAIKRLQGRSDTGFFLMVEGGRVDHAAHANDIMALLRDQLAFDDAVRQACDFAERDADTLVIVTSDHGNANPAITKYAEGGAEGFARIAGGRTSFEQMGRLLGERGSGEVDAVAAMLTEHRGVTLAEHELAAMHAQARGERIDIFDPADSRPCMLGSIMANHYAVAWVSANHTSDHVLLSAKGPWADRVSPAGHITDLHAAMTAAMGVEA